MGRGEDNGIVIHSNSVSLQHAKLLVHPFRPGVAKLVDLGSRNGCFLNESRVHGVAAELHSGDTIRFGYSEPFKFYFPEAASPGGKAAPGSAARGSPPAQLPRDALHDAANLRGALSPPPAGRRSSSPPPACVRGRLVPPGRSAPPFAINYENAQAPERLPRGAAPAAAPPPSDPFGDGGLQQRGAGRRLSDAALRGLASGGVARLLGKDVVPRAPNAETQAVLAMAQERRRLLGAASSESQTPARSSPAGTGFPRGRDLPAAGLRSSELAARSPQSAEQPRQSGAGRSTSASPSRAVRSESPDVSIHYPTASGHSKYSPPRATAPRSGRGPPPLQVMRSRRRGSGSASPRPPHARSPRPGQPIASGEAGTAEGDEEAEEKDGGLEEEDLDGGEEEGALEGASSEGLVSRRLAVTAAAYAERPAILESSRQPSTAPASEAPPSTTARLFAAAGVSADEDDEDGLVMLPPATSAPLPPQPRAAQRLGLTHEGGRWDDAQPLVPPDGKSAVAKLQGLGPLPLAPTAMTAQPADNAALLSGAEESRRGSAFVSADASSTLDLPADSSALSGAPLQPLSESLLDTTGRRFGVSTAPLEDSLYAPSRDRAGVGGLSEAQPFVRPQKASEQQQPVSTRALTDAKSLTVPALEAPSLQNSAPQEGGSGRAEPNKSASAIAAVADLGPGQTAKPDPPRPASLRPAKTQEQQQQPQQPPPPQQQQQQSQQPPQQQLPQQLPQQQPQQPPPQQQQPQQLSQFQQQPQQPPQHPQQKPQQQPQSASRWQAGSPRPTRSDPDVDLSDGPWTLHEPVISTGADMGALQAPAEYTHAGSTHASPSAAASSLWPRESSASPAPGGVENAVRSMLLSIAHERAGHRRHLLRAADAAEDLATRLRGGEDLESSRGSLPPPPQLGPPSPVKHIRRATGGARGDGADSESGEAAPLTGGAAAAVAALHRIRLGVPLSQASGPTAPLPDTAVPIAVSTPTRAAWRRNIDPSLVKRAAALVCVAFLRNRQKTVLRHAWNRWADFTASPAPAPAPPEAPEPVFLSEPPRSSHAVDRRLVGSTASSRNRLLPLVAGTTDRKVKSERAGVHTAASLTERPRSGGTVAVPVQVPVSQGGGWAALGGSGGGRTAAPSDSATLPSGSRRRSQATAADAGAQHTCDSEDPRLVPLAASAGATGAPPGARGGLPDALRASITIADALATLPEQGAPTASEVRRARPGSPSASLDQRPPWVRPRTVSPSLPHVGLGASAGGSPGRVAEQPMPVARRPAPMMMSPPRDVQARRGASPERPALRRRPDSAAPRDSVSAPEAPPPSRLAMRRSESAELGDSTANGDSAMPPYTTRRERSRAVPAAAEGGADGPAAEPAEEEGDDQPTMTRAGSDIRNEMYAAMLEGRRSQVHALVASAEQQWDALTAAVVRSTAGQVVGPEPPPKPEPPPAPPREATLPLYYTMGPGQPILPIRHSSQSAPPLQSGAGGAAAAAASIPHLVLPGSGSGAPHLVLPGSGSGAPQAQTGIGAAVPAGVAATAATAGVWLFSPAADASGTGAWLYYPAPGTGAGHHLVPPPPFESLSRPPSPPPPPPARPPRTQHALDTFRQHRAASDTALEPAAHSGPGASTSSADAAGRQYGYDTQRQAGDFSASLAQPVATGRGLLSQGLSREWGQALPHASHGARSAWGPQATSGPPRPWTDSPAQHASPLHIPPLPPPQNLSAWLQLPQASSHPPSHSHHASGTVHHSLPHARTAPPGEYGGLPTAASGHWRASSPPAEARTRLLRYGGGRGSFDGDFDGDDASLASSFYEEGGDLVDFSRGGGSRGNLAEGHGSRHQRHGRAGRGHGAAGAGSSRLPSSSSSACSAPAVRYQGPLAATRSYDMFENVGASPYPDASAAASGSAAWSDPLAAFRSGDPTGWAALLQQQQRARDPPLQLQRGFYGAGSFQTPGCSSDSLSGGAAPPAARASSSTAATAAAAAVAAAAAQARATLLVSDASQERRQEGSSGGTTPTHYSLQWHGGLGRGSGVSGAAQTHLGSIGVAYGGGAGVPPPPPPQGLLQPLWDQVRRPLLGGGAAGAAPA